MVAAAATYLAALFGVVAGLVSGKGRYHGTVAALNVLALVAAGLALAVGRLRELQR